MKKIQKKEEKTNKNKHKLIDIFITTILKKNTQESFYLLEKFIEKNILIQKIIHYVCKKSLNFIHYLKEIDIKNINSNLPFSKYFIEHYEELSKNNWELHKQLIKEGVNPNEISKIIRNDEVENLQEIAANEEFDYNQIIKPSPYERCTFINKEEVSLIDYAAFFGSVKCFKFLLLNNAKVSQTCKYAVAGGNLEIIHLCEQNHSSFGNTFDVTVQFHRNDVFHYLYENQIYKTEDLTLMLKNCITYYNYELFLFLFEKNLKLSISYLYEFAKIGNLFIVKPFIDENQIFDEILTYFSESGNIELVEYILNQKIIDINAKTIKYFYLLYIVIICDFKIIFGNILKYLIQHLFWHQHMVT